MWATQCPEKFAGKQIQAININDLASTCVGTTTLTWAALDGLQGKGNYPEARPQDQYGYCSNTPPQILTDFYDVM
jgi:hypothetical protein